MNPLTTSFYAGMLFLIAGLMGLVRSFMLGHGAPEYPRSPGYISVAIYLFAATLIYVGTRFLWVWGTGEGSHVPPGASPVAVLLGLCVVYYKGALLYNVASQHYSVETWTRINRVTDLARCSSRK